MAGASASGLNPHLPVGTGVAVRKGYTTRPGGAEKGGDVGGKSSVLSQWPEHRPQERREGWRSRGCPAAIPAASRPPLSGAQVGGRQLPASSFPHPRYLPSPRSEA